MNFVGDLLNRQSLVSLSQSLKKMRRENSAMDERKIQQGEEEYEKITKRNCARKKEGTADKQKQ